MICPLPPKHQRGAALIVALLVFALSAALLTALARDFTLNLKRGRNAFAAGQAGAYLRGGEDLAALALRQDWEKDRSQSQLRDDPTEFWAQSAPPYPLDEGGWLAGRLEDLQGRFNLNSIGEGAGGGSSGGGRFSAAQAQFIRLLQTPEEPRLSLYEATAITEALLDWLDGDSIPRDFGAEDDVYYGREPSYRAANRKFHSVSELRLIAHVTPELFDAIAPALTVYGSGVINIHTAPVAVLRSINGAGRLEPLSVQEGEALVRARGEAGFADVQDLLDSAVLAGRGIAPELAARLGEESYWFLYVGEAEVAGRVTRLYSVLRREGNRVHAVLRSSAAP